MAAALEDLLGSSGVGGGDGIGEEVGGGIDELGISVWVDSRVNSVLSVRNNQELISSKLCDRLVLAMSLATIPLKMSVGYKFL